MIIAEDLIMVFAPLFGGIPLCYLMAHLGDTWALAFIPVFIVFSVFAVASILYRELWKNPRVWKEILREVELREVEK